MSTKIMTDAASAVEEWLQAAYDQAGMPTISTKVTPTQVTLNAAGNQWQVNGPTAREDVGNCLKSYIDAQDPRVMAGDKKVLKGVNDGKYWLRQGGCTSWGPVDAPAPRTRTATGSTPATPPVPPVLTNTQKLDAANAALKVAQSYADSIPGLKEEIAGLENAVKAERIAAMQQEEANAEARDRKLYQTCVDYGLEIPARLRYLIPTPAEPPAVETPEPVTAGK